MKIMKLSMDIAKQYMKQRGIRGTITTVCRTGFQYIENGEFKFIPVSKVINECGT